MPDTETTPDPDQPLPDMPAPVLERPKWSAAEAARRCGVGRATIQRALDDGRITGATKTDDGWRIPVESLLAAGFKPTKEPKQVDESPVSTKPDRDTDRAANESEEMARLRQQVADLAADLDRERAARRSAEQDAEHARDLAGEREKHIDHMALALRLIEAPRRDAGTNRAPATETPEHVSGHPAEQVATRPSRFSNWFRKT